MNTTIAKQIIFRKPSQKYSTSTFERHYQWQNHKLHNNNYNKFFDNDSLISQTRSEPAGLLMNNHNKNDNEMITNYSELGNPNQVIHKPTSTLMSVEEGSETESMDDQTINNDNKSELTAKNEEYMDDDDNATIEDIKNDPNDHEHVDKDIDNKSLVSESSQSFKSAKESLTTTSSSSKSFHSVASSIKFPSANSDNDNESDDAEEAAKNLPDVNLNDSDSNSDNQSNLNSIFDNNKTKSSYSSTEFNSVVNDVGNINKYSNNNFNDLKNDALDNSNDNLERKSLNVFNKESVNFNNERVNNDSKRNSYASLYRDDRSPKLTPQTRNRSISQHTTSSYAPTIKCTPNPFRKSQIEDMSPTLSERKRNISERRIINNERQRTASSPSSTVSSCINSSNDDKMKSKNEALQQWRRTSVVERPRSRLILPSEFVKLKKENDINSSMSSSATNESSTKYPNSESTSTSIISDNKPFHYRSRSSTISLGGYRKPSTVSTIKRPTKNIDEMLPSNALGIERTMLSISVTSGAAQTLNEKPYRIPTNNRNMTWNGRRSEKVIKSYRPMITLGLSSHSKPPQKLDPHSVLIKVHTTSLDNWDALTLMRGNATNKTDRFSYTSYGFVPGRCVLGQIVEVGWKVKTLHRQQWVWGLSTTEKVS